MFPKDTRKLASVLWIDRGNVIIYYMNLACAKLLTVKMYLQMYIGNGSTS